MEIYQTNAALGYNQFAYLIRLDETKNGYNYLCIGTNFETDEYFPGKIIKDLEYIYIDDTDYQLQDSPLFGTFLFDFFIKNYREQ